MMQEYLYNLATDRISGIIPFILKIFLLFFSFVYGMLVRLILFLYEAGILKRYRLACKVISVGNITLGGTGKTPLVEAIAKYLAEKGVKIAILTRGYKKELSKQKKSDEASMLAKHLPGIPILVGGNRIKNALKAIKDYKVGAVLLDDGFQQWRIQKDLEILTIDSTNPFGNNMLIPRGILREPLSSLARADIFVATKTDFASDNLVKVKFLLNRIKPDYFLVESIHSPVSLIKVDTKKQVNVYELENKKVCLLASIGDPATFENIILRLGLTPLIRFYYLDHYQYKEADLRRAAQACLENKINAIITTEKDLSRIDQINLAFSSGVCLYALQIGVKFIKNEKLFFERLSSVCKR